MRSTALCYSNRHILHKSALSSGIIFIELSSETNTRPILTVNQSVCELLEFSFLTTVAKWSSSELCRTMKCDIHPVFCMIFFWNRPRLSNTEQGSDSDFPSVHACYPNFALHFTHNTKGYARVSVAAKVFKNTYPVAVLLAFEYDYSVSVSQKCFNFVDE